MTGSPLTGRVALATGAARGICAAVARRLAAAGAATALVDRDLPEAQRMAAAVGGAAFGCDVSRARQVHAVFRDVERALGPVAVLVNSAGIWRHTPVLEVAPRDWDAVFATNVKGILHCARAAAAQMVPLRSGKIVNVASVAGKEGNPGLVAYSTAKAGVIGLTKALAKEVITKGVYVNAVAPAVIETPILKQMTEQQVSYMTAKIPMGRVGKPEEVAAVVHFLASDDSSFVTAQCYDVSGGRSTY